MSAMEGLAPGRGITSPGSYCLASGTSAPWECEIRDQARMSRQIRKFLGRAIRSKDRTNPGNDPNPPKETEH